MKISKHYEENALVGDPNSKFWHTVKVGITLNSDKELKNTEEIKDYSDKLGMLAKKLVQDELGKIKESEKVNREEN